MYNMTLMATLARWFCWGDLAALEEMVANEKRAIERKPMAHATGSFAADNDLLQAQRRAFGSHRTADAKTLEQAAAFLDELEYDCCGLCSAALRATARAARDGR